jgi:glucose/arabinose dehydrogenase
MRQLLPALFCAIVFTISVHASGSPIANDSSLTIDPVVSGLVQPTSMAFVGAADFLILEQANGKVRRVTGGVLNPNAVLDLDVEGCDERGLLGIALHPSFATNGLVYLFYNPSSVMADEATCGAFAYDNVVDRFTWDANGNGGVGTLSFDMNILTVHSDVDYHNGGSISFGPDGKLYGVIGDGGHNDAFTNGRLQNNMTGDPDDTGIVFRLNDDGTIPNDNPFTAITGMEKVFSYGLRNSFGLAWDPVNGSLWETENGEDDYDEVNRIVAGMNGGWAKIMGPDSRDPQNVSDLFAFAGSAYSDPEFSWLEVVAPTGIAFGGSALGPYENDLFVGDLNNGFVYRFGLNGARTALSLSGGLADRVADSSNERDSLVVAEGFTSGPYSGISDLETGPDGGLYVVSYGNGTVHKIARQGGGALMHDVAITSLKPPKRVKFSPAPKRKTIKLSLQNLGSATETIANQGELDALVNVTVGSIGLACAGNLPAVSIQPPKRGLPFTWAPKRKLTVGLDIAWDCINDPLVTSKTGNHDDFTIEVEADLSALGQTDGDDSNDGCPRVESGDDKGCGKQAPPFRVDLYLK